MSIEALNKALNLQFKNQTPTKRLILILLANYCDEKNSCFPSYKHIAKLAGLKDTKHIANIIKEFEDLGLLKIVKRYKEDGGNISNLYYLTLDHHPQGVNTSTPLVPTPPNTKEETKEESDRGVGNFEEFWKHYPRKENKEYAKTIYKKVIKKYAEKKLLVNVQVFAYETRQQKKDKQYIPMCSTWLNQKRYLEFDKIKPINRKSLNAIAG